MLARKTLIVVHTVLAGFFLPMGLMYAVTGGLYGLGVKGGYTTVEHTVALDQPLTSELSTLVALTESELAARDLAFPSGSAGVKKGGTSFYLEWTGSNRDVQLHPTADPLAATLKVKDTGVHRFFVQLHKAKGGELFKWFAALWMIGLVLLFVTGGIMAFAIKSYRPLAGLSVAAGVFVFVALAWLS